MDRYVLDGLKISIAEKFKELASKIMPWYKNKASDLDSFEKAAEICYRLDADPELFVQAQFENVKNLDHFQASFLHTQYAEEKYKDYFSKNVVQETSIDWDNLYQTQLSYLKNLIQSGLSVEKALMKDYINLYPWFRILITKEPVPEIIEKYKSKVFPLEEGLLEFLERKKFDLNRLL